MNDWLLCLTKFEFRNGERICFWIDRCCSSITLSRLYPELYEASSTKFSTVADNWKGQFASNRGWFLGHGEFSGEVISENVHKLLPLLDKLVLSDDPDKLVWNDGSDCLNVR